MIGGAIFRREAMVHARRPRTYVFQTLFLAGLVLILVPLWPAGNLGGQAVTDRGREIFYYGTYLELILIALIAPTLTASAITSEKDKNTLDLLLLTDAGPFAIVFGKLVARVMSLAFLLFLSLPIIFALLTLGGIDARSVGVAFAILLSTAWFGGALGVFLSTVLRKTTMALIAGYAFFAAFIAGPTILSTAKSGFLDAVFGSLGLGRGGGGGAGTGIGTLDIYAAYVSPWNDLEYLFHPSSFVTRESFPSHWWVNPLVQVSLGSGLALASAVLVPYSKDIGRALGLKAALDKIDAVLARFAGAKKHADESMATGGAAGGAAALLRAERHGPTGNPIYWKETTVNTLGRLRHWMRVNLAAAVLMGLSYYAFREKLGDIEFHKVVGGALSGLLVLAATMIAATSVAKEREDRTLFVLATTPVDCPTYVKGKVQGILRNILFLMLLPFIHVTLFIANGTIGTPSLVFVLLGVPIAAISAIVQGTFVSLVFPTQLKAIMAAIAVVLGEALLPFCCCLPTFNPVLLLYYGIEAPGSALAGSGNLGWALFLSSVFSLFAHILLTGVIYSLIRSGFDRYIGRAG